MYYELEQKITTLGQAILCLTKRYETQLHQQETARRSDARFNRTTKLHVLPHSF